MYTPGTKYNYPRIKGKQLVSLIGKLKILISFKIPLD